MTSSLTYSFSLHENLLADSERAYNLHETYKEMNSLSKEDFKNFRLQVIPFKKNLKIFKKSKLYSLSAVNCYFRKFVDSHALNVHLLITKENEFKAFLKAKKLNTSLPSSSTTIDKTTNQFLLTYNAQETPDSTVVP
jgi:hypothetical protein